MDDGSQAKFQKHLNTSLVVLLLPGIFCSALGYWLASGALGKLGGLLIVGSLAVSLGMNRFSGFRFTIWILIANILALLFPQLFLQVGGFSLTDKWLLLIIVQAIMFGMGTQMSFRDFAQVARMPLSVGIGLGCQFVIMPLLGFLLAKLFQFPPEIGAGLILIGSCSSGLASNVLTFLARGNLALSVTLTAFATALAPLLTPIWMKLLAGSMIKVDGMQMSLDIVKMVIVPLLAAFVGELWLSSIRLIRKWIMAGTVVSVLWLLFLVAGGWQLLVDTFCRQDAPHLQSILSLPGFIALAFVVGAAYSWAIQRLPAIPSKMPILSMWGIVYFTLVTTAKGRDELLAVGLLLVLAVTLHNLLGYLLGFWSARLLGMSLQDARTVAIEVGSQNGAMATGLARSMNKLESVGLAAMIFAPLMNVTGSIIANYWHRKSA